MQVNWDEEFANPAEVERKLATLIIRLFPEATHVDGSGGDGGRDVQLVRGGVLTIWEIKSFPDRIGKSRKNQVTKSLLRAGERQPDEWFLVAPLIMNPWEITWFDGLRDGFPFIKQHLSRTWINGQLAKFPDLLESFDSIERRVLIAGREFRQEAEIMANGIRDFAERHERLTDRANRLSEFYDLVPTALESGEQVVAIVPTSDEAPPIIDNITIQVPLKSKDPSVTDLAKLFRATIETGRHSEIEIPGMFIGKATTSATGKKLGFGDELQFESLRVFVPSEEVDIPVLLFVFSSVEASEPRLRHSFRLNSRRRGNIGITLQGMDAHGTVELTLTLEADAGLKIGLRQIEVEEILPVAAVPAMRLTLALIGDAAVEVRIDGRPIGPRQELSNPFVEADRDEREWILEATTNLAFIQDRTGQYFALPEHFSGTDRYRLEKSRRLLEDGISEEWWRGTIEAQIEPGHVKDVLTQLGDDRFALAVSQPELTVTVADQLLILGPATLYSPDVQLTNRAELVADLEGSGPAKFTPTSDPWQMRLGNNEHFAALRTGDASEASAAPAEPN